MAINLQRRESLSRPDEGHLFVKSAKLARESAKVERWTVLLRAREYVLQALSKEPENLEWKVLLAGIDADLGARSEALKEIEEVLASDPKHSDALRLRDRIRSVAPPS
jgi:tetratricopeptide (TPR) repeat protein